MNTVKLLPPSPTEKKWICDKLDRQWALLSAEQRVRVENASQFLVLMLELTTGKELIEIIESTLKDLRRMDEAVYQAYEYLCFAGQYELSMPIDLLERLDDRGRFYRLLEKTASSGLIFADEQRPRNLQVGHAIIAEHSARLYNRDPRSVFAEIAQVVDTKNWVDRGHVAHLLLKMAQRTSVTHVHDILKRHQSLVEDLEHEATISEMIIWRSLYKNLGRQEAIERCEAVTFQKEISSANDCLQLLGLCRDRVQRSTAVSKFQRWLEQNPEDHHARYAYLGLVERHAPERLAQTLAETSVWLSEHPQDGTVRSAYLGLADRKGSKEQIVQVLTETQAWLVKNPQDAFVRAGFLALLSRKGTPQQVAEALDETYKWLAENPQDSRVRATFLSLFNYKGSAQQAEAALSSTQKWLAQHHQDAKVRTAFLALLNHKGTPQQADNALSDTQKWLAEHHRDAEVRAAFLALLNRKGTPQLADDALSDTQKWLAEHPQDIQARQAYLALVEDRGTVNLKDFTIADTKAWLEEHPTAKEIWDPLIGWLSREGRKEEALEQLVTATAHHPENQNLLMHHLRLGQTGEDGEQTKNLFERLISKYPMHYPFQLAYAKWLSEHGADADAEARYKALIAISQGDHQMLSRRSYCQLRYRYGILLLKRDRLSEAVDEFQQALKTNQRDTLAHEGLGSALWKLEDFKEAEREFRSAIYFARLTKQPQAKFHTSLGRFYFDRKRLNEAYVEFESRLRGRPYLLRQLLRQGAACCWSLEIPRVRRRNCARPWKETLTYHRRPAKRFGTY